MEKQWDIEKVVMTEKKVETESIPEELLTPEPEEELDHIGGQIKVAILSEDGVEEIELTSPKEALERAGIKVDVVCPHNGTLKAWDKTNWGHEIPVDKVVTDVQADDYDAVVLPGGVMNPDKLRQSSKALDFLKQFIKTGKTIAAICHGAQTLIETGMIRGNTMTSYPSLQTDLRNAGVNWVDKEMVHDGQYITSRGPRDLNAFNDELIRELLPER
jgi:protease I